MITRRPFLAYCCCGVVAAGPAGVAVARDTQLQGGCGEPDAAAMGALRQLAAAPEVESLQVFLTTGDSRLDASFGALLADWSLATTHDQHQ